MAPGLLVTLAGVALGIAYSLSPLTVWFAAGTLLLGRVLIRDLDATDLAQRDPVDLPGSVPVEGGPEPLVPFRPRAPGHSAGVVGRLPVLTTTRPP